MKIVQQQTPTPFGVRAEVVVEMPNDPPLVVSEIRAEEQGVFIIDSDPREQVGLILLFNSAAAVGKTRAILGILEDQMIEIEKKASESGK